MILKRLGTFDKDFALGVAVQWQTMDYGCHRSYYPMQALTSDFIGLDQLPILFKMVKNSILKKIIEIVVKSISQKKF